MKRLSSELLVGIALSATLAAKLGSAPVVNVSKSVGSTAPQVGDTFRYYVAVDVPTGGPATGVTLSDVVPAGLQFVQASPGGSYSGGTVSWNLGSLSCAAVQLTLSAFSDAGGSWGVFTDVMSSDTVTAASTINFASAKCDQNRHSNWFYLNPVSGYSVASVSKVVLYFQWRATDALYPVRAWFQNNGDLSTGTYGPRTLTAGAGQASDVVESWDITAAGGPWTFEKLQYLTVQTEHLCGGSGNGAHSAYMNRVWAVVEFSSCGASAWFDVLATNSLLNGQVVNNTAQVSGTNFTSVNSNNQAVTITAPTMGLTKTASPSLAVPGDSIQYSLAWGVYGNGVNFYDDFSNNYGKAPIPNWDNNSSNKYDWVNSGGVYYHQPGGYTNTWVTSTGTLSDSTVSVDFQLPAGGGNASIAYLYQTGSGRFYKSKVYQNGGSPSGYSVDVQTGPAWSQVCGNANIPTAAWNAPPAWNNIKVVIKNYAFVVYINNVQVFTCSDPTAWVTSPGYAGIYNDGSAVNYDNFSISTGLKATSVQVWDTLPACMTYVSSSPAATVVSGNYLRWDLGTKLPGQSGTILVNASSSGCPTGVATNNASAGAANAQIVAASVPVTLMQPLSKTASVSSVASGTSFTYTLSYTAPGGGTNLSDNFSAASYTGTWVPVALDGTDSNITTAFTQTGGTFNLTHWNADIAYMAGSSGINGKAAVTVTRSNGQTPGFAFGYQGGKAYIVDVNFGYNAGQDAIELKYYNGSGMSTLQTVTGLTLPSGAVALAVTRQGNQFVVYINGTYYTTLTDAAKNLPGAGLQGLYSAQATTVFDNYSWTPDFVAAAQIWDTLPAGLALITATAGTAAGSPLVAKWTLPSSGLAPGQTWSVQMSVSGTGSVCGNIVNTAVGGPTGRAWYSSNSVTVTVSCGSPTSTPTLTPSPSPSATRSATATASPTGTPSASPTGTPTPSPSPTLTPSSTPSASPSTTPSATPTATPTASPSLSPSPSASRSPTSSPTATASPSPAGTATHTPTATVSATPSASPTLSASPSQTLTATTSATPSESPTLSSTASQTLSASPTATPSDSPTLSPTPTLTLTATPSASPTESASPTPSSSPSSSFTATPSATSSRTASPSSTPSPTRSASPSASPTSTPSATPSGTPSPSPSSSATPTRSPSPSATASPSATPSLSPSHSFTGTRTATPSASATPTLSPSFTLTQSFTFSPSPSPSPSPLPWDREDLSLEGIFPHPVGPGGSQVLFGVPLASQVRIQVFTLRGEEIIHKELSIPGPGVYDWRFYGQNQWSRWLSNGVYYLRITMRAPEKTQQRGRWITVLF